MVYTVGEMAKLLGITASTLRYYDKEGLLPFVERSSGGIRMFQKSDFEWLQVIGCMKKAGMSIKDIRQYIEMALQGDETISLRLAMFRHQRVLHISLAHRFFSSFNAHIFLTVKPEISAISSIVYLPTCNILTAVAI